MATVNPLSRGRIPNALIQAKSDAIGKYFRRLPRPRRPVAFAATAAPEHNVVGVGVGRKRQGNILTDEHCVRFYVERKLPKDSIPKSAMLPDAISGVVTDVVETGRFRAFQNPIERSRLRPAQPGGSVGFKFSGDQSDLVMAGTFGAVVCDAQGQLFILSNNHVLANQNQLAIGDPIFQPGLLDGGDPNSDGIANLTKFVTLDPNASNVADCAIAQFMNNNDASATVLPKVGSLTSNSPIDAYDGMIVEKTGRTTSYTCGTVTDVSADVKIDYDVGQCTFTGQILITGMDGAFSAGGDSGSLIVDRETKRATGLLFAGSATQTIANHIGDVLGALGVTILA